MNIGIKSATKNPGSCFSFCIKDFALSAILIWIYVDAILDLPFQIFAPSKTPAFQIKADQSDDVFTCYIQIFYFQSINHFPHFCFGDLSFHFFCNPAALCVLCIIRPCRPRRIGSQEPGAAADFAFTGPVALTCG